MATIPDHIFDLIIEESTQKLSTDELAILHQWLQKSEEHLKLRDEIATLCINTKLGGANHHINRSLAWQKIVQRVEAKKRRRFILASISVAASIAIIVTSFFMFNNKGLSQSSQWTRLNKQAQSKVAVKLVLQSGKEVVLNDSTSHALQIEGSHIQKENNKISYASTEQKNTIATYHELIIPKGVVYSLALADGTVVTLNSESSIKFPTQFNDSIREVWMEGEAYFSVEHNPSKPFIVHSHSINTRVLGTEFNICDYPLESKQSVTLVNGSVQLAVGIKRELLKPGYQMHLNDGAAESMKFEKVDTYLFTSWKDGIMYFDDITLEELMKRLTRWYNFDYHFSNDALKKHRFTGGFKKSDDLHKICLLIEKVNDITFSISENKITINEK